MTALIVDDSLIMREQMASIIKNLGHEIIMVENGEEAIKAYNLNSPDFVTMDITMPVMDGITALEYIMKIDPDAKVIMSTSNNSADMIRDSIEAGASWYITKPFTKDKVSKVLNKVFGNLPNDDLEDNYMDNLCDDL
jgi:two-component system chemotaxis response regulator CheY